MALQAWMKMFALDRRLSARSAGLGQIQLDVDLSLTNLPKRRGGNF